MNTYCLLFEKSCLRQSTKLFFNLQTPFTTKVVSIVICNNTEYLIKPSISFYTIIRRVLPKHPCLPNLLIRDQNRSNIAADWKDFLYYRM